MDKSLIYYLNKIGVVILLCLIVGCYNTKDAEYYYNKQKPFKQGSVEEQKYLDKALELDSLHVEALIEKSVSFNKRGQYAIGMHYLNKGVALNPVEHLGYRGFVKLYMLRDYEGALQDFLRLDRLTPGFRDAPWGEDIYKVVGVAYMGMRDFAKASYYFNKSINRITKEEGEDWIEPRTFLYQGICLMEELKIDSAIYYFDKRIQYCSECPSGYFNKAKALLARGEKFNGTVLELLNTANKLAKEENIESSPYFELPYQFYTSDIKDLKVAYGLNNQ